MRNVGIALSQATLQELAYSLGIEKNVADMTEAQKAQLRYIQIIRQSSEWQTDMAKTLMSPANATRILRQQFTLLARAIGNVLIPIVMTVIPYVMVLTQWLTKLANKVAKVLEKLFGIKLDFNYDREISGLGGIADGIGDIGDAAGKSAKKLNTMLAPFDDLNVVQNEMDKNGGGVGDLLSGGDLGVALPEYDALAGLTDKFRANMDKAEKNLKRILPIVTAIAVAFAGWKIFKGTMQFLSLFSEGGSIATGMKVISGLAGKLGLSLGALSVVLLAIGVGIGVGVKSTKLLGNAFNSLEKDGISLEESFANLKFGEKVLLIYSFINPISRVMNLIKILIQLRKELAEGKSISEIFTEWFPKTTERLKTIKNFFKETFTNIFSDFNTNFLEPMKNLVSPIIERVQLVANKIVEIFKKIGEIIWAVVSYGITQISNFIKGFVTSLATILSPIANFVYGHVIKPIVNFFKNMITEIIRTFKGIGSVIASSFVDVFKATLNGAFYIIEKLINGFINGLNKVVNMVNKIPGVNISKVSRLSIPRFEEGGYPTSGDLFFANENGVPEMVGRIGNKTAVANQDQITTSITNAVVQGLAQSGMNNQSKSPTTIYIGNKKVYEGYGDYIEGENDRYGTNMIRI